jgi:hypothetical protein
VFAALKPFDTAIYIHRMMDAVLQYIPLLLCGMLSVALQHACTCGNASVQVCVQYIDTIVRKH